MFLGTTFFCGKNTLPSSITDVNNIKKVKIQNGKFDDLYITQDITESYSKTFDTNWNQYTILHALFKGSLNAGNVDFTLKNTSHLLLKRRMKGTFDWKTIEVFDLSNSEDLNISGLDLTAQTGITFEYAIVPYFNGAEGTYSTAEVKSEFEGLYIVDKETIYGTLLDIGFCDTKRNKPSLVITTLNGKYPYSYNNANFNYETGTAEGVFIPTSYEKNGRYVFDFQNANKYRKEFINFISDGNPKILKHYDGRIWLICVMDTVSDDADNHIQKRKVSFEWTEIGDVNSMEDLYLNGLGVSPEWWFL